jgi:hypothetical protein
MCCSQSGQTHNLLTSRRGLAYKALLAAVLAHPYIRILIHVYKTLIALADALSSPLSSEIFQNISILCPSFGCNKKF